jgi:hypothetical protein
VIITYLSVSIRRALSLLTFSIPVVFTSRTANSLLPAVVVGFVVVAKKRRVGDCDLLLEASPNWE